MAEPGRGEAEAKAKGLALSLAMRVSSHELRETSGQYVEFVEDAERTHRLCRKKSSSFPMLLLPPPLASTSSSSSSMLARFSVSIWTSESCVPDARSWARYSASRSST